MIPNPIIADTANCFSEYYTHTDINNLLFKADIENNSTVGNKKDKVQNSLVSLNKNEPHKAIEKYKKLINEYLHLDFMEDSKNDSLQRELKNTLFQHNLITIQENITTIPPQEELAFLAKPISLNFEQTTTNSYVQILQARFTEIDICIRNNAPLASIFLIGSTLEGMLTALATNKPRQFNSSPSAPKRQNSVKPFKEWTLSELIDVSENLGYIGTDVKKFSHVLRDFRNYMHPREQLSAKFSPDEHTAKICLQVLSAAFEDLKKLA